MNSTSTTSRSRRAQVAELLTVGILRALAGRAISAPRADRAREDEPSASSDRRSVAGARPAAA